ncbi:MAG TPA: hypothetical protein VEJ63_21165, partial [Planctomycetota bacterium]|nr:hypothetical protein [Planctomycetota bacterium]
MPIPFFNVPLNLPHAATIASRLIYHLQRREQAGKNVAAALTFARELADELIPYRMSGENPAEDEAKVVVAKVAELARKMVDEVERHDAGDDRLGQAVRNLFECLELGQEGTIQ